MTTTISRLYDSYSDAEGAVTRLESAGVPHSDISIVANNSDNWYASQRGKVDRDHDGVDDRAEGAGAGAGIGAGIGGAAGLLAGLGLLAIPGLGPVVAAGWLASTAAGEQLRAFAKANTPTGVISLKMQRPPGAISSKAQREGISLKPVNRSPYNRRATKARTTKRR
nr:hypothetical protein [Bradyrhizobium sp. SEMIA]